MYYLQKALKPMGPYARDEVIKKIRSGDVRPYDLVLSADDESLTWLPALDVFRSERHEFPCFQGLPPQGSEWRVFDKQDWVLLEMSSQGEPVQSGPYSFDVCIQKAHASQELLYCWKPGLSGWVPVIDRPEFQGPLIPEV